MRRCLKGSVGWRCLNGGKVCPVRFKLSSPRRYRLLRGKRKAVYLLDAEPPIECYREVRTDTCVGCTEYSMGQVLSGPCGCDECGYTGKTRHVEFWGFPGQDEERFLAEMFGGRD